jgi:acetoin utilization deacetylase AcuC-like enzyme
MIWLLPFVRCFYHPGYSCPLPEGHPFPMDKFWRVERMVREECASARITVVKLASAVQLLRVHTSRYLADIRTGALSRESLVRLGLPPCEGLLTRSRRETGGTIAAMWAAIEEGLACNLAGGTHHAFADRGLGYCVLNDVAIAIRDLHAVHTKKRVFVIDTDSHQGKENNEIFTHDDRGSPIQFMSVPTIRRRRFRDRLISRCHGLSTVAGFWTSSLPRFPGRSSVLRLTSSFGLPVPTRMSMTSLVR